MRDPLTILGRESVEGLGMEKEVLVVARRSAEGERPGLSLGSWAGWCYASWQPGLQVQEPQAGPGHGTHFFYYLNLFVFNWRIIALQYCVGFCHAST